MVITAYINRIVKKIKKANQLVLSPKALLLISLIIPSVVVTYYFFIVIYYSINFPYNDDFHAIIWSLNYYILYPNFGDRIAILFAQHNEHRIVFVRLVALLQYYFLNQLDFKWFIIIGNSSLIVIMLFLYKSFTLTNFKSKIFYLLPISLLLFNFRYWEIIFWAMGSLQNLWVNCFVLLSLYFLFKRKPYAIYLSIFLAIMASFTSANGMMVFFAGGIVLFMNRGFSIKKKLAWLLSGLFVILFYFFNYQKPIQHPDLFKPVVENPLGFVGYIFAFLGSAFTGNVSYAIIIGICLVLFIIYLTIKKYYKANPIIYSFMGFILITSVLAALSRFGFGLDTALSSRYSICSTLLVACCYIAFISLVHHKIKHIHILILTSFALLFSLSTQSKYLPQKIAEKKEFDKNYALITAGKFSNFNFGWAFNTYKDVPKMALKMSTELGYYKFTYAEDSTIIDRLLKRDSLETDFCLDNNEQIPDSNVMFIAGWSFIRKIPAENTQCFIAIKDTNGKLIDYLKCEKVVRHDVTQANKEDNTNYDLSGFNAKFDFTALPREKYRIYIVLINKTNNYRVEINTNQVVSY